MTPTQDVTPIQAQIHPEFLHKILQIGVSLNDEQKKELQNKLYRAKATHNDVRPTEYGYYVSHHAVPIISEAVARLNVKSVIDLGIGMGFSMIVLHRMFPRLAIGGIDNEPLFLHILKRMTDAFLLKQKDLLTLNVHDIKDYDLIFSWEPFYDHDLSAQFARRLISRMKTGQILIYHSASGGSRSIIDQAVEKRILTAHAYRNGYLFVRSDVRKKLK